jgi:capsular exopolysaccharide synthesis family protein
MPGLAEQWLILRRRWRLWFATAGLLTAVTSLCIARLPVNYTATGTLLYDPAQAATPGDPLAPATVDAADAAALTVSQGPVIGSLQAARALATRLDLAALPQFNPALRHPGAPAAPDAVALAAQRALTVAASPESRIITVSFTAGSPALAADAVNAAMQIYLDHERTQAVAGLDAARDWLGTNAAQLQTSLEATETQLAQAEAAAGVVAGAQASLTTETASRLAASLVAAQAELAMNQARLSAAAHGDAAAANAAIAPNLLPLRKEQADLSAQVQALAGAYGPDYPPLVTARQALRAITAGIAAETGREVDAARAEVAADAAQIDALQTALAAARDRDQAEAAQSAPIRVLQERADANRDMLQHMTLQADELTQEASLIRPDARIISAASPPTAPSSPSRVLILAASVGLGLCLGILLAALAEALDTGLRSGGDVRASTGLPCFAQVPEIAAPRTAVLDTPFCLFAEQIRALQTGLALAGPSLGVIAITAARPGEGKTTLTIALGRALAASGRRVVAVDGDIRQPSFDPVFGTGGLPGLTDHLAGLAPVAAIIRRDAASPLDVIPAGGLARPALSLFMSPALPALLRELRERYDVVLLDVPPAFALAEGRVLARQADGALLCVRWGDTPRRVVIAAVEMLREAQVRLIGAALTRVDRAAQRRSGFPDAEMYQPRYGGYFRN